MNVHDGVHLEVITMNECNDYFMISRMNAHEIMH